MRVAIYTLAAAGEGVSNVGDQSPREAKITRRFFDAHPVLYLEGHFDYANIDSFEPALRAHAASGGIISLERVRFADAGVLGAFVRLHAALKGNVIFIVPSSLPVARLFAITHMSDHLRLVPTFGLASALADRLRESTGPGH